MSLPVVRTELAFLDPGQGSRKSSGRREEGENSNKPGSNKAVRQRRRGVKCTRTWVVAAAERGRLVVREPSPSTGTECSTTHHGRREQKTVRFFLRSYYGDPLLAG